jgi:hypothetical protein
MLLTIHHWNNDPSLKRETNPINTMKSVFFLRALLSILSMLSVSAQQAAKAKNYRRGNEEKPSSGGTRVLASGPKG